MQTILQEYFPMIRSREEVLETIRKNRESWDLFQQWNSREQEEFLDFCSGVKGVKLLYDAFFKEIFSPEFHRNRLEEFLGLLIGERVKVKQILPNDSVRLADEQTLLVTDIVIEAEDGTIANLEIQKIGYAFPGQRAACYSADLLLRQYKRVKEKTKDKRKKSRFSYRDLKKVYTIVLFEKSTWEFHGIPDRYLHHGKQVFDTGLELETLQEYVLVPLDIFQEIMDNKPVENKLEAWLMLISSDKPERIVELLEKYPEFQEVYEEIYHMCRNVEDIMRLFSKELAEMDRNTISYMIEELEEQVKAEKRKTKAVQEQAEKEQETMKKEQEIMKKELEEQKKLIARLQEELNSRL